MESARSKYQRSLRLLVSVVVLLSFGAVACGKVRIRKADTVESTETSATSDLNSQKNTTVQTAPPTQGYSEYEGVLRLNQMSRAQMEYNKKATPPRFSSIFNELELKFQPDTEGYIYRIDSVGLNYVIMSAQAKTAQLRSFTALVLTETNSNYPNYPLSTALVCQTEQPSTMPVMFQGAITTAKDLECPAGSKRM